MNFKIIKEFREFAVKGNMIDIAIGIILGTSFNKVVDALVKEIFLPPLSLLTDGIHLQEKKIIIRQAVIENEVVITPETAIGYGKLIEAGMDFMIIGFTVFIIVKLMNRLKKKAQNPENKEIATPKDIELLHKIATLTERQVEELEQLNKRK